MLIWLIVLAIFAVLGATGYYKGAIRATVSLIGLGFATFLALPLSPFLRPLVPKLGLVNPVWDWILPPAVVFLVVTLIFLGLGFLVHAKVAHHFKYATDDYTRIRWERLNRVLGLCIGLTAGGVYSVLVGLMIYIFGYPAVQLTNEESPLWQRLLATARKDLQSSGMDKTMAALDLMHEKYYLSTDLVGLLYQNPIVLDRLLNYPAFLALGERDDVKELTTDTDFLNGWQTKVPILNIVNQPKVMGLIKNAEVASEIRQVDLKDLYRYLGSGKSDKYDEERILGRWRLDVASTFTLTRKKNPDMTAAEMSQVRLLLTVFMPSINFMATPDNKAFMRVQLTDQAKQMIEAARAAVAAAQSAVEGSSAAMPQMDARMMQRYGLRPGQRPGLAPPPETEAVKAPEQPLPGIPELRLSGDGTWERVGTKYRVKIKNEKGQEVSGEGTADEDRLLVTLDGQPLVFIR